MTSLLALTALRLRDRQVLIKRTDIIENLGNATIIASDKTGTLTQNRMTVENLWCNLVRHCHQDKLPQGILCVCAFLLALAICASGSWHATRRP